MGTIHGFSHLTVEVTDLDRSEKFYHEIFGLDLVGRDLVNDSRPTSMLAMNTSQRVLLVQVPEVQPFRKNSGSIHHGWLLTIEQFEAAEKRLAERGFNIDDSRKSFRAVGERSLDVFDPDGHRYQIQCYGPEAKEIVVQRVGEIECGNVRDFPVGTVKPFTKGRFFLVHLEEGFQALSRMCTHMNGNLRWQAEHWEFYCPMHGVTYDRKGICKSLLRRAIPMRAHPVTIAADGTITVNPEIVIERADFDPGRLAVPPQASAETHRQGA